MRHLQLYLDLPERQNNGILLDLNHSAFLRFFVNSNFKGEFNDYKANGFDSVIESWATDCPLIMEYYEKD